MIFWVGLAMMALSLAALVTGFRHPIGAGLAGLWAGTRWQPVPYIVALLALYAWLLPWLGFPTLTVILLTVLFKTVEPQRWSVAILGALAATAVSWLVFARWLGTQLPLGTLWMG
jgi:hypothetical protein